MSPHRSLRALFLDVPPGQAAVLLRALADAGWHVRADEVHGPEALGVALQRRGWQAVLYGGEGDDAVPAGKALALVRLADPHLPFVAVSPFLHPGGLSAVVRGLDAAVPIVSAPAELPRVVARELEQARMRRRVGGAHRYLAVQQAVADHVASGPDPEALCARVLATVGDALGWSFGAVWRPAADGVLRCTSVWSAAGAAPEVAAFAESAARETFAAGQGLPGRVWAFRRAAWVADVAHERSSPRAQRAVRAGLLTAVAFPLAHGEDACAGVMELYSAGIHEPNAEAAAMYAAVGGQLAQYLERAGARRAEAEARNDARALLDGAGALVVGLDAAGRVRLANRAACELLGMGEAALLGRDWFETALPDGVRAGARAGFARLLAGEMGDGLALRHAVRTPGGGRWSVSWRWSPTRGPGGVDGILAWGEPAPVGATAASLVAAGVLSA
jgi:PAS domain S-box-containing protein